MRKVIGRWMTVLTGSALAILIIGQSVAAEYWHQPLAPQGKPPSSWSELERSLKPEDCGQCHGDKLAEWSSSLHARAFSPGLVGQLLDFDAEETQSCMNCHAPLAEQITAFEAAKARGKGHMPTEQGLAAKGNSCSGCHLRENRRHGPSQRGTGKTGVSVGDAPHGGVVRSKEFEESEFCAACHQFPQDMAINGKPLENTLVEWQTSPAAREGRTCQSCHMPDRKHLWRGIHDPGMVESGLKAEFYADADKAGFVLTSVGVGHAFPTYVTPKVILKGVALDANGQPLAGTERSHVIQRRVESVNGEWVERFDTRLAPGQSASLNLPWPASGRVRFWLEVHPDDFYDHDVYDGLLRDLPRGSHSARLIAEADAAAQRSRFRLFEQIIVRP